MRLRPATLLPVLILLGCDPMPPVPDGGGSDLRALPGCVNPDVVEGRLGMVSVPIDTRMGEPGLVPLSCTTSGSPAPQWVVAYSVPGTGSVAIEVSTVNTGTDVNFDTVIAVRRSCLPRTVDELAESCFDDGVREGRSRGSFIAEGGEVLYLFVTGYGTMYMDRADEGLAQLDITASALTPPTLDSARVLVTGDSVRIDVVGGDEGRDATGVYLTFHGPAGDLLDLNADGVFDDADVLTGNFDRPVLGVSTFTETATLSTDTTGGASFARVRIVDRPGVLSERVLTVVAQAGSIVSLGEACDATRICGLELACNSMSLCAPGSDRVAACGAASVVALEAPADGRATTTTRQDVLMAGAGLFTAQCSEFSGGTEDLYLIRVPVGRFDVILTTDSEGSSGETTLDPDTILYVRRTCTDATATSALEDECNDDITASVNQRSTVEVLDVGDVELTAFVEMYNGAPEGPGVRYELAVTLRPVLDSGASCDPSGVMNRCAGAECVVATRTCP
jgi:hypothetical protein